MIKIMFINAIDVTKEIETKLHHQWLGSFQTKRGDPKAAPMIVNQTHATFELVRITSNPKYDQEVTKLPSPSRNLPSRIITKSISVQIPSPPSVSIIKMPVPGFPTIKR